LKESILNINQPQIVLCQNKNEKQEIIKRKAHILFFSVFFAMFYL